MAANFNKQCEIIEGPSKYDLQASLFDAKHIFFTFKNEVGEKRKVKAHLRICSPEDGSRESWIGQMVIYTENPLVIESRNFYYNSRNRKGYVTQSGDDWKIVRKDNSHTVITKFNLA